MFEHRGSFTSVDPDRFVHEVCKPLLVQTDSHSRTALLFEEAALLSLSHCSWLAPTNLPNATELAREVSSACFWKLAAECASVWQNPSFSASIVSIGELFFARQENIHLAQMNLQLSTLHQNLGEGKNERISRVAGIWTPEAMFQ